jgi:predicted DNA-binding transcriptional regulator AlpA
LLTDTCERTVPAGTDPCRALQLISISRLCELLDVSEANVLTMARKLPDFPKPYRVGAGTNKRYRFKLSEVEAYIARCQQQA